MAVLHPSHRQTLVPHAWNAAQELAGKSKVTQRRWKKYEAHISQENPITKGMR